MRTFVVVLMGNAGSAGLGVAPLDNFSRFWGVGPPLVLCTSRGYGRWVALWNESSLKEELRCEPLHVKETLQGSCHL